MKVRQSLKGVMMAYALVAVLTAAIAAYWLGASDPPQVPLWAPMLAPAAFLLLTGIRHLRRRTTSLDVEGDRLRYEAGLFSKTSRIMELSKVQDVRVDQSFGQRIIDTGDLSLETAGESSRIVMTSIDRPKEVAQHILDLSRQRRAI
ncbi:MAG: rane-flanked domain [Bryobacterales bacterium]|nr:rane-flanked domain [Bryobacterales bacterium]